MNSMPSITTAHSQTTQKNRVSVFASHLVDFPIISAISMGKASVTISRQKGHENRAAIQFTQGGEVYHKMEIGLEQNYDDFIAMLTDSRDVARRSLIKKLEVNGVGQRVWLEVVPVTEAGNRHAVVTIMTH